MESTKKKLATVLNVSEEDISEASTQVSRLLSDIQSSSHSCPSWQLKIYIFWLKVPAAVAYRKFVMFLKQQSVLFKKYIM
jgi:hypothetical protein